MLIRIRLMERRSIMRCPTYPHNGGAATWDNNTASLPSLSLRQTWDMIAPLKVFVNASS
jgi:hypothetical protein